MEWYRQEKEGRRVIPFNGYRSKKFFKSKLWYVPSGKFSLTILDKVRLKRLFIGSGVFESQPVFAINVNTWKINQIIAYHHPVIPKSIFINATPETLITTSGAAKHCRSVITQVHETGSPQSITLPFTIPLDPPESITKCIHFKKDPINNTVIAYGIYDFDFLPI